VSGHWKHERIKLTGIRGWWWLQSWVEFIFRKKKEEAKLSTHSWYLPANSEKLYKIMELPMYITTYCHWTLDRLQAKVTEA
jgi:hypothetical protein